MTFNAPDLLAKLRRALAGHPEWSRILAPGNENNFTLHLAIFREPYLSFIMEGRKTIETRFSKRRYAPYGRVTNGDIVVLKRSAGDIVGVCVVQKVWFYRLDRNSLAFIKQRFGSAICAENGSFWDERKKSSVATLMLIGEVAPVQKIKIRKTDRRAWVVFEKPAQRSLF